jgi:ABC-type Fe3+ transport system substrate-binding protein
MECIGNNDPIVVRGHPVRTTLMIAGDHAVQGDNFFYDFLSLKLKNPKKVPIQEVYEAPITIFAGAVYINKNTPRPYAAALYTDWILSDESQQFLVSEFRGPVTLPHPFLKDDAQLVVFSYETKEISDQLLGYWNKYVAKRG